MFWSSQDHQAGCVQRNTDTTNSVEDVYMYSFITVLSVKTAKNV
jgi:hypothetical protein